jgi:hypothetical protein
MKVRVPGGFTAEKGGVLQVDAYDVIDANVPKETADVLVNVRPSEAGKVKALLICSDNYTDLSFTVDEGVTPISLEAPMLLAGSGAVALLGETQKDFLFTNSGTTDANVRIFVARMAISEP